jgi:5'(3')-deoxyribonucleotidase
MKKTIYIDMDLVLNDFAIHFFQTASSMGVPVEGDIYENYDLTKCLKVSPFEARKVLRDIFNDRNFWKTLPVQKDANNVLIQLQDNYILRIVTALPKGFNLEIIQMIKEEKLLWLKNNLPSIKFESVTFVEHSKKDIGLSCDYIIDDYPEAVKGTKCKWIKMKYGYNKDVKAFHTVCSWKDILLFFSNLKETA